MHDLPPLKSLRVFEACIRLGNFTKAARELNVGQPAISHQINALERDLGIRLFERKGALTVPTADALTYYRSIAGALEDMARASVALRKSKRPPGLALATYPGIAMFWLLPRLSTVRQANPDLAIRVTTAERDQDIPLEDVDCAILFGDGDWPGFESHKLMGEIVTPVASPALAASLADCSRSEILKNGPLIHLEDQDQRWFTWRDWRNQRSPETETIDRGITVTNHGIAIHQTLMGHGIALGWRGVIDEMIDNKLLVALDSEPLSSPRGYYLVAQSTFMSTVIGKFVLQTLTEDRPRA
ncbi:transcriptional regulator [Rhizobium leguminosarum bv. trifolii WSM2297]|uniref:Transcriptional regulator n=1 Tax=Rhizobium leguminosarum bv. trifolii WSM2297 TaxID=754762 RepID=J0CQY7_RHILT|nr:LysR substrate-binding domain-containing protein [Rhizobium leguminosarum]EJC82125.1 transcriptional regulator [Rhizobium leguminosarum bv. trifolii WSM2297]